MTSRKKCMICKTATNDTLNLGEMKTYQNTTAHYYCLLLASTIKQSGQDEEGILGFLPSDIKNEIKNSGQRTCSYCFQKGAAVLCSRKNCKTMFHLPCGIKNGSGHQFHDSFLSNCRYHRVKQKFNKPTEPQICPICYDGINFRDWTKVLWAPCCKKQSFFHRKCIQQMALSAGYFFKCPMCNNCDLFQKTMKHHGVFIPDRDASWELEPNAFEELLYRHTECNVEVCLCRSGRTYDNFGSWNIILCSMCGSQGTHIRCSKLKKNEDWICGVCAVEKKSNNMPVDVNDDEIISLYQPSTSNMHQTDTTQISDNVDVPLDNPSKPKKRKRNRSYRSSISSSSTATTQNDSKNYSNLIDLDSEDSDIIVIDDEPNIKCLIGQDRSHIKVHNKKQEFKNEIIDNKNQDSSSSCADFMNLVITDVRSISDNFIENEKPYNIANEEFKNIQNKSFSVVNDQQEQQSQSSFFVLQEVYRNNDISVFQKTNTQHLNNTKSNSSDDIVVID